MREFYYNEEIYNDIQSDENLVICARLGSGKSESVKKHLIETKKDKILVVVNDGIAQGAYWEDLSEKIIIHNKLNNEMWNDVAVRDFEDAINEMNQDKNVLCITKSKFNKLIIIRPNALMDFHKIIVDEQNGINPILVTDLTTDIDKIINNLSPVMKLKTDLYYDKITEILRFLKRIQNKYADRELVLFYKEEIPQELQQLSKDLMRNLRRLYNEEKIFGLKDIDLLFGVLNSMSNNKFYLGDINMKGKKQVHILFANTFLKDYIDSTNSIIKILDGTADNIKPLYDWLNIKVKKEYKCNEKNYPNLRIHVHTYKGLTPAKGRKSLEHTTKVVDDILKSQRQYELTFTVNSLVREDIFTENFSLLEYAFNGNDVGSNKFRDKTEMNIIYYQTLPRHYRMLYNKIFKDLSYEESCSHKHMLIAESELIGALLCQLIGRLKIRSDNDAEVNVHCYCVSRDSLKGIVEHYKLTKENVVKYEEVDIGVDIYNVKENLVMEKLKEYLEENNPSKVILVDWIRKEFYDEKTNQKTINNMYGNIRNKIKKLDNYELISKRGRGFKAYLQKLNTQS